MGQKTHPVGFRLQVSKDWKSTWFTENSFASELESDVKIRKYLKARLPNAGISKVDISRTSKTITITIFTARPGIVIGKALRECVGDGAGINRMGYAYAPLDEALARTVVDFSGRGYSVLELMLGDIDMGDLPADLVRHFLESFAREAGCNLNIEVLSGLNNHHKAEAAFKSMAKAIKHAVTIDDRQAGKIPSTKGTISD